MPVDASLMLISLLELNRWTDGVCKWRVETPPSIIEVLALGIRIFPAGQSARIYERAVHDQFSHLRSSLPPAEAFGERILLLMWCPPTIPAAQVPVMFRPKGKISLGKWGKVSTGASTDSIESDFEPAEGFVLIYSPCLQMSARTLQSQVLVKSGIFCNINEV